MSNKIGVLTVAFDADEFIDANAKQFEGFNLFHLVVCSKTPWHGKKKDEKTFIKAAANKNLNSIIGDYTSDAAQRNAGLTYLQRNGVDWTLVVDADEFWEKKEIIKLLREIEKNYFADAITAPNMHVYWKDMNSRIYPDPQPDNPIVAIRTKRRFDWSRLADVPMKVQSEAEFHHLSYVRSDEKMHQKMIGSEHSHELVPKWYENVWKKDSMSNLHPVIPQQFAYFENRPVPDEIKELF